MNKIIIFVFVILLSFFAYGIYDNSSKKSIKSKRLECQNKTITFESIYTKNNIDFAQKLLKSKNYTIKSDIEYSKFMPSVLKSYFNIDELDSLLIASIAIENGFQSNKKLLIDYYLYENDKNDKNKKNDKAKMYAGYLLFEFKLDNKTLYKIQTDYMKEDGSDIKNRLDCVIKSFLSIKG